MIPPFDEHGYLPPGIHRARLDEIEERFGRQSELRRAQIQSLRWLMDIAKSGGIRRIVLNGSFVTDELEPNDIDCVVLLEDEIPHDPKLKGDLDRGLPFLDIQTVDEVAFDWLVTSFFAFDRQFVRKGVIEVIL